MVEGGGFEPPKAPPTDLQSVPFDRSGTPPYQQRRQKTKKAGISRFLSFISQSMELAMGLEPATP
jgi:hypothetical protein